MTANLLATIQGYEPWSGRQRRFQPPVHVAMLLDDYDNAANKWFNQNLSLFYPIHPESGYIHVKRTQTGAPREIHFLKSLSGRRNGSVLHIYTQDQESRRCAGPTFHEFYVDEPQPKAHFVEIARGLQASRGKTVMTMTPISEPWIFDELYNQAGNMGGSRPEVFAITAFPDENLKSRGGHLDDRGVEEFRATLSEEEKEARVHGRWMHLLGRVYKAFEERVHCIDSCPEADYFNGTHGLAVDPHDRIPFAVARFVINPANDLIFFDEWPREPFEEMRSSSYTLEDYATLFGTFSLLTELIVYGVSFSEEGLARNTGPLYPLLSIYLLLTIVAALAVFGSKWRRATGMERAQLQYMGAGLIIPVVGGTTTNLLLPLLEKEGSKKCFF